MGEPPPGTSASCRRTPSPLMWTLRAPGGPINWVHTFSDYFSGPTLVFLIRKRGELDISTCRLFFGFSRGDNLSLTGFKLGGYKKQAVRPKLWHPARGSRSELGVYLGAHAARCRSRSSRLVRGVFPWSSSRRFGEIHRAFYVRVSPHQRYRHGHGARCVACSNSLFMSILGASRSFDEV